MTELSLRGQQIIAQQPEISYAQALAQVQRLKEISKINQSKKIARRILKGICLGKQSLDKMGEYTEIGTLPEGT